MSSLPDTPYGADDAPMTSAERRVVLPADPRVTRAPIKLGGPVSSRYPRIASSIWIA